MYVVSSILALTKVPLAHGTCTDNVCKCEEEFEGADCQYDYRDTSECDYPGILLENGTCCESGIYNYTGQCCSGEPADLQLDKNGGCCVDGLDMCGNCNPQEPEFRDLRGTCCKVKLHYINLNQASPLVFMIRC